VTSKKKKNILLWIAEEDQPLGIDVANLLPPLTLLTNNIAMRKDKEISILFIVATPRYSEGSLLSCVFSKRINIHPNKN